jgi:hypothetical protein
LKVGGGLSCDLGGRRRQEGRKGGSCVERRLSWEEVEMTGDRDDKCWVVESWVLLMTKKKVQIQDSSWEFIPFARDDI